jgi:hypothetical protein
MRWIPLGLFLLTAGCDQGTHEARGVHVISWSTSTPDRKSVPGLDTAQASFGMLGDRPAIVIWSDGGGSFGTGYDRSRKAAQFMGSFRSQDARTYPVEATTADGKSGDVTIDGQTFDLAKGSVFLIKTGGGVTTVKQLTTPISLPQASGKAASEELQKYAAGDATISGFFEAEARDKREEPQPAHDESR